MSQINIILYQDLLKKYPSSGSISYGELLETKEWAEKRALILKRDRGACTKCGKGATMLHSDYSQRLKKYIKYFLWFHFKNDSEGLSSIESSDKPYDLHIHHTYYILNKLPWEYPDNALTTLCNWCHWKFHEENRVPFYETEGKIDELLLTPCSRCNGAGWFPEYQHVASGICFRCHALKYEELIKPIIK